MSLKKDLKIKGQIKLTAAGDIELSVFKENNFADTYSLDITDEGAGTDSDTGLGLRVYTTGKEPTNPVGTTSIIGLTQDQNWIIDITFSNTAGDEVLRYVFTAYASSTVDYVYPFEIQGKSTQAKTL